MNDFSVLRIIGRGGFGEVYGCRKVDTGKMYAMKCLDKKRIKMKQGETLALNERTMLSLVSTGEDCPFIVCMTYAFHTPSKLCFILDLMNGGDLHYHLSQHGVFNETNMKFYATEIILGLEHMHRRWVWTFFYCRKILCGKLNFKNWIKNLFSFNKKCWKFNENWKVFPRWIFPPFTFNWINASAMTTVRTELTNQLFKIKIDGTFIADLWLSDELCSVDWMRKKFM